MLLSSSSIKTFKDCRMAYRYGYELGLEPTGTEKAVVSFGTAFHAAIAAVARGANEYECADPDVAVSSQPISYTSLSPRTSSPSRMDLVHS